MASSLPNVDDSRPIGSTFRLGAPPTLGDEEVRALESVFRGASGDLAEVWSAALNAPCTVEVESIVLSEVATLDELAATRSSLTSATISGFPGQVLVVVPVELGLIAVDLMLGGSGRPGNAERGLSAIDADLLSVLVTPTLDSLADALGTTRHSATAPAVSAADPTTDAATLELEQFDHTSVVVRFTTQCGESTAAWLLAMTASMASALTGSHAATASGADDEVATFQAAVQRRLVQVPLHAVVEFPPVRMRSTDLIALRVDDVVTLDCPVNGWLRVVVDGETIASARAARSGDHLACQIVATAAHPPSAAPTDPIPTTEFSPAGPSRGGVRQGAS